MNLYLLSCNFKQTKNQLKSAHYLHQKGANCGLNILLLWYFGVDVAHKF